jgi:hypothetical protein
MTFEGDPQTPVDEAGGSVVGLSTVRDTEVRKNVGGGIRVDQTYLTVADGDSVQAHSDIPLTITGESEQMGITGNEGPGLVARDSSIDVSHVSITDNDAIGMMASGTDLALRHSTIGGVENQSHRVDAGDAADVEEATVGDGLVIEGEDAVDSSPDRVLIWETDIKDAARAGLYLLADRGALTGYVDFTGQAVEGEQWDQLTLGSPEKLPTLSGLERDGFANRETRDGTPPPTLR